LHSGKIRFRKYVLSLPRRSVCSVVSATTPRNFLNISCLPASLFVSAFYNNSLDSAKNN
jgi:hypothetical protein